MTFTFTIPLEGGEAGMQTGTHFTCFTGTTVRILTHEDSVFGSGDGGFGRRGQYSRCSVCLLYWYKSTNTGAARRVNILGVWTAVCDSAVTQFTCFTGTKVQVLTQKALQNSRRVDRCVRQLCG